MSTRQYFVLRTLPEMAGRHAAATQAERQQILRQLPVPDMPNLEQRVRAMSGGPPLTGWMATARELAEMLGHLHQQLRRHSATPARDIFRASTAGDPLLAGQPFVAAKGGSDHGVMAYGFIIEAGAETGWLIAVIWNGQEAQPPVEYLIAVQGMVAAARGNPRPYEPSSR